VNYTTDWINDHTFNQAPNDPAFYNDPYTLYRELHTRQGPIFWQNYDFWCLAGFDAVNATLKDRRFARLPPPGTPRTTPPKHLEQFHLVEQHSLLQLEPPEHTRLRKRVNRAFVARQIDSMASDIEALVNNCIDRFIDDRECNLLTSLATPVPVTVIAKLLGVPEHYQEDLLGWSHAMVKVYTMTQNHSDELLANKSAAEFHHCLVELIKQRRVNPKDDLLSHLASSEDPDTQLSDNEIVSVAILLLNAGHEATVHQFGNLVYGLLVNHCAPRGGFEDINTAKKVVNEGLRHDAPLHLFLRYAQCDVDLGKGVTLKRGEQVALLLGAANRDPHRFEQAHKFWPERPDGAHVSLGGGIHFCIGATLAALELRILVDTLFKRIPELTLARQPSYKNLFHFHGLEELPVQW